VAEAKRAMVTTEESCILIYFSFNILKIIILWS